MYFFFLFEEFNRPSSNTCICRFSIYLVRINFLRITVALDGATRWHEWHINVLSLFDWCTQCSHGTDEKKKHTHKLYRREKQTAYRQHNGQLFVCIWDMTQCCVYTFVIFVYLILYVKQHAVYAYLFMGSKCSVVDPLPSKAACFKWNQLQNCVPIKSNKTSVDLPQIKLIPKHNLLSKSTPLQCLRQCSSALITSHQMKFQK